jgi:membrane protein DedA with SNARE-associated domain
MDPATTTAGAEVMAWISAYGYIALLPLFIIEGPIIGITSGVLISLGLLRPIPVLFLFVVGTIITDSVVYWAAHKSNVYIENTAIGRWFLGQAEWVINRADSEWQQSFRDNYFSLMMLAKLAPINLLATFVAVGAGMLKVPLRRFYKPILIAQPIWSAAVIGFGYYLGGTFFNSSGIMFDMAVTTAAILAFIMVYYKFIHDKVMETQLGRFLNMDATQE